MSSNKVTIICHWGGDIVNNNEGGVNYVGGEQNCMRVKPDISFRHLVSKVYACTGIDRAVHRIKMTCRFPDYFDAQCTFTTIPIVNNATVEAMLCAVVESTRLACIHLYVEIELAANDVDGDVSRRTAVHVPLPTIHEDNPSSTQHQSYQVSQIESYMPPVNEDIPSSTQNHSSLLNQSENLMSFAQHQSYQFSQSDCGMAGVNDWSQCRTQHQSTLLSQSEFQAQSSHQMFMDLNAPAGTSDTEIRECTGLEAVRRLVHADDFDLDNQGLSNETGSEMSGDSEHSDDGVPTIDNNLDDATDRGQPSTSMVRMYEPMAEFFTHISDPVQPYDGTLSYVGQSSDVFDPKRDEFRKGLRFKDKETMVDAVRKYNVFKGRHFKVSRNTNTTCWEAFCKYRHTSTCLWRFRGSIQRRHGMFEIVTYNGQHSCSFSDINTDHPGLTASLICGEIYPFVKDTPSFKVSSIVAFVKERYTFTPTYQKAWNAKQKAIALIFGDWEKSYNDLPKFLGAIKKYNDGTIWHSTTYRDTENPRNTIFQRVFWAFGPCIEGFKSCRPMLSIDATHLYGKYKGKILIAMGKDANNMVFPLAFAIVDEESRNNWGWFLSILRRDVVGDRLGMCLISDRHKGILAAVADVSNGWDSSKAHHRFCLRHVQSNFNTKFHNAELKQLMWDAGAAFEISRFNEKMDKIRGINRAAWEYLMAIPPAKWTISHDGGYRFGDMTTNVSECFNGVLKDGRCLPITACVQLIFFKCVSYFESRRALGLKSKSEGKFFTPNIAATLEGISSRSGSLKVHTFNRDTGEASVLTARGSLHAVFISQQMCTCGWWQTYKIPCPHAVQVMKTLALNSWNYISPYYTVDTHLQNWGPQFHPLYPEDYWDEPIGRVWIPEKTLKRQKGRPRSTRITNEMDIPETRTTNCCGICRQPGHDRRTCTSTPSQLEQ